MKAIILKNGIPSERIQELGVSIFEILEKLDEESTDLIVGICEKGNSIEDLENELIEEFTQGLRDTLEINGYKYLLHEQDIIEYATIHVKTFVIN